MGENMDITKRIQSVVLLGIVMLVLSACITARPDGRGTSYAPDLSMRGPNDVVHEARSPVGSVFLKKKWFDSEHWLSFEGQTHEVELPDGIRTVEFVRDYGTPRSDSLLVYRYSTDDCAVAYQFVNVTSDKLFSYRFGDCVRPVDMRVEGSKFIASLPIESNRSGHEWVYERGQYHMQSASYSPSGQGTAPREAPREEPTTVSAPNKPSPQSRSPVSPSKTPTYRRLPTEGGALPSEVDVVEDEGADIPTVVLN